PSPPARRHDAHPQLHAYVPGKRRAAGGEPPRASRTARGDRERQERRHDHGRQELVLCRAADVERGRDQARLAPRPGSVRDRRRVQEGRVGVPEGPRQAARQPGLARRLRLLARLLDHALARSARAAAPGRPDRTGTGPSYSVTTYSKAAQATSTKIAS